MDLAGLRGREGVQMTTCAEREGRRDEGMRG